VVVTRRRANRRSSTQTRQPWRERPALVAAVIAEAAKTRSRSRHGCPLSWGCVPVRISGRHRPPPERSRRKPCSAQRVDALRAGRRVTEACGAQEAQLPRTGGTPRARPCSPSCSPSPKLRPSRSSRRDESTDEITHGVQNVRFHERWRPRDCWTWPRRQRGLRPAAKPTSPCSTRALPGSESSRTSP
jgi:hypothetical protein